MNKLLIFIANVLVLFACGGSSEKNWEQFRLEDIAGRTEYTDKAIATIVDDDIGAIENLEKIKAMADRQGIKITFAAITDKLDDYDKKTLLLEYQSEGFHIVSHSKTHSQAIWRKGYADFDMKEIKQEMENAVYRLQREGFEESNFLVYPYGAFPEENHVRRDIMELAAKYHKAAFNSSTGKANYPPRTERYYLNRILISKNRDMEELKKTIDKEISMKGWLVFLTHSNNANEFDVVYTEGIVKYVLSKNVKFMTLAEAWRHKGVLYE